jgi:hypothetical protein
LRRAAIPFDSDAEVKMTGSREQLRKEISKCATAGATFYEDLNLCTENWARYHADPDEGEST